MKDACRRWGHRDLRDETCTSQLDIDSMPPLSGLFAFIEINVFMMQDDMKMPAGSGAIET